MNNELHEYALKAQQQLMAHNYQEAINLYQHIVAKEPNNQECLHFLGLAYAKKGEMEQAIHFLQQAQAIHPEAAILNNLANAYKQNNQPALAIDYYLQAIELNPEYAQAHNNVANVYALQNQYNEALRHYIKATHAAPDFIQAHFNLGLLLLKSNQLEAAKTQFNNVLSLNPDAMDAWFYLGIIHLDAQSLEAAEQAFKQVLTFNEEHVQALVNLGVIALKNKQDQTAIDYFTKALALDNDELDARNNLAATFMHHDRFENALMHYDVLLQTEPNNEEYLYNSGVAQMALGHLNEAILLFEQLIGHNPAHAPALNNLAAVHIKLDNRDKAKGYLEQTLVINPDDKISQHLLHAICGVKESVSVPEYAKNLFNNYALYYDQHMQGTLNYSIPGHISRTLQQLSITCVEKTLDLGCGTGLSGAVVREYSKQLTGVDIAEKMIANAQKKGIYDTLTQQDIIDFLQHSTQAYDLIIAADVLPYLGDLEQLIVLISQHLSPNAYFIATCEVNKEDPWQLQYSARFSHNPHYIATLAAQNNLSVIRQELVPGRIQNQQPLELMLYTLQKMA